jgi:Protein of unknown function (DUF2934)
MPAKRTEPKATKAPAARKPAIRRKKAAPAIVPASYEDIATRAYFLALEGGHDPFENWLRAEHELAAVTA